MVYTYMAVISIYTYIFICIYTYRYANTCTYAITAFCMWSVIQSNPPISSS